MEGTAEELLSRKPPPPIEHGSAPYYIHIETEVSPLMSAGRGLAPGYDTIHHQVRSDAPPACSMLMQVQQSPAFDILVQPEMTIWILKVRVFCCSSLRYCVFLVCRRTDLTLEV